MVGNRVLFSMFGMRSKRLFVLLLVAAYIVIPLADSIACDDCTILVPSRTVSGSLGLQQTEMAAVAKDTAGREDASSPENEARDLCTICFNAASVTRAYNHETLFSSVPFTGNTSFIAALEPAFSIIKPPQN